jgi:hypothetical protein
VVFESTLCLVVSLLHPVVTLQRLWHNNLNQQPLIPPWCQAPTQTWIFNLAKDVCYASP